MSEKNKVNEFKWSEGLVDKKSEHFKITYKENSDIVALIGKGDGQHFIVQFLISKEQLNSKEILKAVRRDLNYFFVEKREENPWQYAKYHCSTGSNMYASVHWGYHKNCHSEPLTSKIISVDGKLNVFKPNF